MSVLCNGRQTEVRQYVPADQVAFRHLINILLCSVHAVSKLRRDPLLWFELAMSPRLHEKWVRVQVQESSVGAVDDGIGRLFRWYAHLELLFG